MPKTNISNPGASGGEKQCGGEGSTGNRTIINTYVGIIGAAASETKAVPHLKKPGQKAKPVDTDAKLRTKGLVLVGLEEAVRETKEELKQSVENLLVFITKTTIVINDAWRLGIPKKNYVRKVRIQFKTKKERERAYDNRQNMPTTIDKHGKEIPKYFFQEILSAEEITSKKSLQEKTHK